MGGLGGLGGMGPGVGTGWAVRTSAGGHGLRQLLKLTQRTRERRARPLGRGWGGAGAEPWGGAGAEKLKKTVCFFCVFLYGGWLADPDGSDISAPADDP